MTFNVRIPQIGSKGPAGSQIIEKTNVAPGAEDGAVGDMAVRLDDDGDVLVYGKKTSAGWPAGRSVRGPIGNTGWSPLVATVVVDTQAAFKIIDWVGGSGVKPEGAGKFIGAGGLVDDFAAAAKFAYSSIAAATFFDDSTAGLGASHVQAALEILSSGKQPVDDFLTALAGLSGAAGSFVRWEGAAAVLAPLVGTVSQTDGIPTGAIIERGSNANGHYVRLADGTQMCWYSVSIVFANSDRAAGTSWTYPAAFASTPKVFGVDESGSSLNTFAVSIAPTLATTTVAARAFISIDLTRSVALMAIGRWS